jgi:CheY-like chemotaxis protein
MRKLRRVRAANDAPPIAAVALGRSALSLPDASPPPSRSRSTSDSEREQAIATGCDEFDTKQIEFEGLIATIRRVLGKSKPR